MDAATQQAQAAQARLSRSNHWIIQVDKQLHEAAEKGWPHVHCEELLKEPEEVQDRVIGYFQDRGFQAYRGQYTGGWDFQFPTVWFSSVAPVKKEPGVFKQFVTRLFGGPHA